MEHIPFHSTAGSGWSFRIFLLCQYAITDMHLVIIHNIKLFYLLTSNLLCNKNLSLLTILQRTFFSDSQQIMLPFKWTASVIVPDCSLHQMAASSYQECKRLLNKGTAVWNRLPATVKHVTHTFKQQLKTCSMMNTIRHCCSIFASLAPLYKTLVLLTYHK